MAHLHTAQAQLLGQSAIAILHEACIQLDGIYKRLSQDWQRNGLVELHRSAHMLVGSAAALGFAHVSHVAREYEHMLYCLISANSPPTAKMRADIAGGIEAIRCAADELGYDGTLAAQPGPVLDRAPRRILDQRLIFMAEDDVDLAQTLAQQISNFGYTVRIFNNATDLIAATKLELPAAIISDIVFPEGISAGPQVIEELKHATSAPLPVIFMSSRSDIEARLQAVRVGGDAYFTKPIDIVALIDKLDELTTDRAPEPYRILIAEDGSVMAAYYSMILEQAGMIPLVVNNPLNVLQPLNDFRPDLILMDMYMPGCTGLELAAVIRQQQAFVSIPIVFLSSETARDMQLAAMNRGGDDFLTKPIQPDHLITSITARVQRSRVLRSFMVRDSLTGLFNHTTTKSHLDIEVARAGRYGTQVAFAVIDIDNFKQVNDTYGHPTGDCVIKSLARLLQQRLRNSDVIGRYGGEEFAVILPGADGPAALRVLDELRERFANLQQVCDNQTFSVTFSCGVAVYPSYDTALRLTDVADKALYEAKRGGRNRVVLAEERLATQ